MKITRTLLALTMLLLAPGLSYANSSKLSGFPEQGRIYANAGIGQYGLFSGDGMLPLYGSNQGFLYTDLAGAYSTDDSWLASLGAGARVVRNSRIWGAYVFGERTATSENNRFWVVNPGLEFFTQQWDAHINGYFPTSSKRITSAPVFASNVGIYKYTHFNKHQQFDNLVQLTEEIGTGVDGELGYTFTNLRHLRVFAGGYHFQYDQQSNINGATVGLEYPLHRYIDVIIKDSYDNKRKNNALLSLRFRLGGVSSIDQNTIQDRLRAPITRHVSMTESAVSMPTQKGFTNTGVSKLFRDNIWFFNGPGGSAFNPANGNNQCTFAHPCAGNQFNQANINSINGIASNANFYFTPGQYNATGATLSDAISLNNGQSLFGRSNNYSAPASGTSRALFVGGFNLPGNNLLDGIRIYQGNSTVAEGILIDNGQNIVLNNIEVGDPGLVNTDQYASNINITGNSSVQLKNSQLYASSNAGSAFDIQIADNSRLNVYNSNLYANTLDGIASGLFAKNDAITTIDDSHVNTVTNGAGTANGAQLTQQSHLTINNSTFTAQADSTAAFGLLLSDDAGVNINNSVLSATTRSGAAFGLQATDRSHATLNHSSFIAKVEQQAGFAVGVSGRGVGTTITMNNSFSSASNTAENGSAIGVAINDGAKAVINKSSIIASTTKNAVAIGIGAGDGNASSVEVNNSNVNVASQNAFATIGVSADSDSQVTINNSTINATSDSGTVNGIAAGDSASVSINNSTINATSNSKSATGFLDRSSSTANINHSHINASSQSSSATGVEVNPGSQVNLTNHSRITANSPSQANAIINAGGMVNDDGTTVCMKNFQIVPC